MLLQWGVVSSRCVETCSSEWRCCVAVLVKSMPAIIAPTRLHQTVPVVPQDGVTGFHAGQIDPDDLLQSDVTSFAGTINR